MIVTKTGHRILLRVHAAAPTFSSSVQAMAAFEDAVLQGSTMFKQSEMMMT